MSASKGNGTNRKYSLFAAKAVKKPKEKGTLSNTSYRIISIIIVVTLVASLGVGAFQFVVNSGNFTAFEVGDAKIQKHEANFYYMTSYMSFVNSYGDYLSYFGLDTTISLKKQAYTEDMTWHDYFLDAAMKSTQEVKMLLAEAKASGMELSEENAAKVDQDVENLKLEIASSGVNYDIVYYLSRYYGSKMTIEEYKRILSETYLSQQYSKAKYEENTYSDDQIGTFYSENKKDFDLVDYRSFLFSATPEVENPTEADTAAAKSAAKSLADIMQSAITDEESFIKLSRQNASEDQAASYEDASYTLRENTRYSDISSDTALADWLFDDSRKSGDSGVVETASGSYVVFMKARYRNDYNTVNVRHILAQFLIEEGATEPTAEAKTNAKAVADALYEEWKNGDATEASFAALATERTDDAASAPSGGLYENMYKGQMVAPFEDWSFDPTRKPGDAGIVETSYGYHLMYFVSSGSSYWKVQVESTLRGNDYTALTDSLKEKYPLKENSVGLMAVGLPG